MPRYAANLSMLWPELATPELRIEAAARAGFAAAEILFVHQLDRARLRSALEEYAVALVLFDADPGDWSAGERGLLCLPGEDRFRRSVEQAVAHAELLGVGLINLLAGIPIDDPATAWERSLERLRWATAQFGGPGLSFVVEAINPTDMPGYLLGEPARAARLVWESQAAWLGVQFDAYHAAMVGQDPRACWVEQAGLVRHVQIADVPGRHEPGTGTADLTVFLAGLDAEGYTGWVGCEYHPSTPLTENPLGWLPER